MPTIIQHIPYPVYSVEKKLYTISCTLQGNVLFVILIQTIRIYLHTKYIIFQYCINVVFAIKHLSIDDIDFLKQNSMTKPLQMNINFKICYQTSL